MIADNNTLVGDGGGANLAFGDWGNHSTGRSAYIDDKHYAAIEGNQQSTVIVETYNGLHVARNADATTYLVSGNMLSDKNPKLCNTCDYMKWGTWGGQLKFKDGQWQQTTADVNLGWYVAGKLTDATELAGMTGTATFSGSAIGNVANNGATYIATGGANMTWNFGNRAGTLNITNFDSRNFSYGVTQPNIGINHFQGPGAGGVAVGSFVDSPTAKAAGAIGNWNAVENQGLYRATGIFGVGR
jgi:hypothetical protein